MQSCVVCSDCLRGKLFIVQNRIAIAITTRSITVPLYSATMTMASNALESLAWVFGNSYANELEAASFMPDRAHKHSIFSIRLNIFYGVLLPLWFIVITYDIFLKASDRELFAYKEKNGDVTIRS